jgi:hypothetical protein
MALPRPLVAARMNMIRRCMSLNHRSYSYCGGRGIRVCEEWLKSSRAFYDWALSNGYAVGLYLDRINNDLGYSPSNCRFITPAQSSRNRRNNIMITAWGETKHQRDWISDPRCTQKLTSIIKRELSKGKTGEEALTYHGPQGKPPFMVTAWSETKALSSWLKDERCFATSMQIHHRIHAGVRTEDALRCGNGYRIVNDRGTIRLKLIPRL